MISNRLETVVESGNKIVIAVKERGNKYQGCLIIGRKITYAGHKCDNTIIAKINAVELFEKIKHTL